MGLILFVLMPALSEARVHHCGKIEGKKIVTYGGLSCKTAKSVYRSFLNGHIPSGWNCGQSVGGCGKGPQGFYFR